LVFNLQLKEAFPFRLAGPNAAVRFEDVGFAFQRWRRQVLFGEIFGNRSTQFWSTEQAVSRAQQVVLAALATRKDFEEVRRRTVLLLGKHDDEGLARLNRIADVLRARGYDPKLLSDFPDQPVQNRTQKAAVIGLSARFVVVDDSVASGHLNEVTLLQSLNAVMVLLRAGGIPASSMTAGASVMSNVILEQAYDAANPDQAIAAATEWAEQRRVRLQERYSEIDGYTPPRLMFPWRQDSDLLRSGDR